MTCYLVKRIGSTPIPNGEEYTTQRIRITNVTSVAIATVNDVDVYAVTVDGATTNYSKDDYVLNVIG